MLRAILAESTKSFWMPERASTVSGDTDWLFNFILYITYFFFALIALGTIYFVVKYRHRKGMKRQDSTAGHSTALELTWTIIPTILVLVIYYFGFRQFLNEAVEPPNAYEITATGRMWNWTFTYPNGHVDPVLHVPAGVPVRVILKSEDVIHSLFIPAFRMKKDVVPGRFNRMWFQALKQPGTEPVEYPVYCAGYCGTNHSTMLTTAVVHDPGTGPKQFDDWLEAASDLRDQLSPIEIGARLYKERGCATCHSVESVTGMTGPTWKDLYGSQVKCTNGGTFQANDEYITESIEYPAAKIVEGFQNVMPSFKGQFKDYELAGLIAYMKSISVNFKGDLTPLKTIQGRPLTGSKPSRAAMPTAATSPAVVSQGAASTRPASPQ